jgi:hypothetical protein
LLDRRVQEPPPPGGRWRVRRTPMPLAPASGDTATSVSTTGPRPQKKGDTVKIKIPPTTSVSTTGPSPQGPVSSGVLSLPERVGVRASPVRDPSPWMGEGGAEKDQGLRPHSNGHVEGGHVEGVDTPKEEGFPGKPPPPGARQFHKGVETLSTPAEGTARPVLDTVHRRAAPAFRGTASPVRVPFVEANLTTAIERGGDPLKASASGLPFVRAGAVLRPEGSLRRAESNRVGQELPPRDGHPVSTLARVRSLDLVPPSPVLAGGGSVVLAAVDTVTATGPTRPPLVFLKRSGTDAVAPSAGRREQDPRPVGSRRDAASAPAAMPVAHGCPETASASQTLTVLPEAPRFGLDVRHYEQLIEQLSRRIFFKLTLALERRGVRRWP